MPAHSLSKLLCLFFFTSFFLTATCLADESDEATSQPPVLLNAETYGVSDGLSQSTVTSVAEDADGYIWIGTLNGLNRFDGKEFKQFYANDETGLNSSYIRSIVYSYFYNELLVGTDEGLYTYSFKNENFSKLNFNEPILNLEENQKEILITSEVGQYIYSENKFTKLTSTIPTKEIKSSIIFKGDIYNLNRKNELYINNTNTSKDISDISFFKENIYLIKDKKLYRITQETQKEISNLPFDYIVKSNNSVYLTYKNSFYKLNNTDAVEYLGELGDAHKIKNLALITRLNNGIIFSNLNEGFTYIKDSENIIQNIKNIESAVWSVKNSENLFVVASQDKEINIYNRKGSIYYSFDTEDDGAKSAILYGEYLYYGTKNGLYKVDTKTNTKIKILDDKISVIKEIENLIYIGTANGTLYIIKDPNDSNFSAFKIDNLNPIFDILKQNEKLYIATQGGLFYLDNGVATSLFDSDIVFCMEKYNNNVIFGTSTGIYRYDSHGKNHVSKLTNNGKPIFSIKKHNEYILASSIKEILLIKNSDFSNITVLDQTYGAQIEYNTQGMINIGNDYYMGGSNGISHINTETLTSYINKQKPIKTIISGLSIFNIPQKVGSTNLKESITTTKKIMLKYSDYPFTLTFNSPAAAQNKDEIEYQYKLTGLSDNWITSKGINFATYTNLSPGSYVFNVFAIDPLTHQKGDISHLEIKITPPWWLSFSAKTTYILLISLLFFLIIKSYLKKREIQKQIALSEERLKLSLWGSGDEMWDWDIESGKIYRSNIWGSLEFPRDGQRSGQKGEESNIHPQDQERVRDALNRHFYGETDHFEATYRVRSKNGEWLWILDRAKIVERDDKDHALRMTGTIKNISSFKTAEEQLRLFERAIENISEGVFILDTDFNFVELNEAACNITRYTKEQSIGRPILFEKYSADYNKQIKQLLRQQGQWNTEIESIRGDSSVFLMELTIDAIYDEQGLLTHYVGVFSDISHRKQQEEELRRLTNNDLLTGLPNRSNLQVTLENLVKKDHHHTLMILDLDNFKKINDSLGHQVGDDLLCQVSSRIAGIIPKHTSLYRLGGDEFAILVDKNPDIGSSALIANDVIEAFNEPFTLSGEDLVVGVSIGIVLYPEDEQNEQALLRKADIAMYHAKSAGGNRYQFYSESLNRNALRQLEVESLIREGLKDDLFEVYFQPKISLRTGKLAGMEALVRLNHPQHGLIPPVEFIPLAEETGLIVEIGDVVLKKACFAAQKWREDGLFTGRVAVNLSSRQFALPDLQTRIESILRLTRLPANNLELEITEGTVIKQPEKAIKVMQQLTRMGISLALDDFGTGYSSLSYLKRFPIHTLKIDKAFVDDIDKSDRDLKMVDSIITIAHNMGLSVVGEGVEQTAQLNILRALNCEEIQGFIYSKAISENEFTEYLKQDNTISTNQWDGTN